jgi:hypothetical protein
MLDPKWKERGLRDTRSAKVFLDKYPYSSYLDYIGPAYVSREERTILNPSVFPEYFLSADTFEQYMQDWLSFREFQST